MGKKTHIILFSGKIIDVNCIFMYALFVVTDNIFPNLIMLLDCTLYVPARRFRFPKRQTRHSLDGPLSHDRPDRNIYYSEFISLSLVLQASYDCMLDGKPILICVPFALPRTHNSRLSYATISNKRPTGLLFANVSMFVSNVIFAVNVFRYDY